MLVFLSPVKDAGRPATSTLNRFSALQQSGPSSTSSSSSLDSERRVPQRQVWLLCVIFRVDCLTYVLLLSDQSALFWYVTGAARVETAASETDSIDWTVGTAVRTETGGWTGHVSPSLSAASAGRARTGLGVETCAVCPAWPTRGNTGAETGPPAERPQVTRGARAPDTVHYQLIRWLKMKTRKLLRTIYSVIWIMLWSLNVNFIPYKITLISVDCTFFFLCLLNNKQKILKSIVNYLVTTNV